MNCLQSQQGFTLIEIMIAITIFAIGLLAVAGMQTTSVKGNADSQLVSESVSLGQSQIEQLLSLPYEHADLATVGPRTKTEGNYTYTWTVTRDDFLTNTKTIQLDITYNARGLTKQTQITALKADVI